MNTMNAPYRYLGLFTVSTAYIQIYILFYSVLFNHAFIPVFPDDFRSFNIDRCIQGGSKNMAYQKLHQFSPYFFFSFFITVLCLLLID